MNQKADQRKTSEEALLQALQEELAGGARLSAEGVAQRAGVNKALLYRWFGGLSGLIGAFAASPVFMPDAPEILALCPEDVRAMPPRQRFGWLVRAYVHALARRPATVQILLRLPSFETEALDAIALGRGKTIAAVHDVFGASTAELGFDPELGFNLLLAGACQLLGAQRTAWRSQAVDVGVLADQISDTVAGCLR